MASGSPTGEPALDLTTQHSVTARRFPPPSSIGQHVLRGLLIALMFPGYLIWDLARYRNSQEGRAGTQTVPTGLCVGLLKGRLLRREAELSQREELPGMSQRSS
jgi:hypothetical protein